MTFERGTHVDVLRGNRNIPQGQPGCLRVVHGTVIDVAAQDALNTAARSVYIRLDEDDLLAAVEPKHIGTIGRFSDSMVRRRSTTAQGDVGWAEGDVVRVRHAALIERSQQRMADIATIRAVANMVQLKSDDRSRYEDHYVRAARAGLLDTVEGDL